MLMTVRGLVLAIATTTIAGASWADEPYLSPLPGQEHEVAVVAYAEAHDAVRVTIDFARLLVLDRPASTIVVGNPAIVEANLSDDRTVILTGKTAGSTNFMALDESGDELANVVIEVIAAGPHLITVHQGVSRQTYTCVRRCDPVLSVGDDTVYFNTTASQIEARHGFAGVDAGAQ